MSEGREQQDKLKWVGLVAEFDAIKETAGPDGKTPTKVSEIKLKNTTWDKQTDESFVLTSELDITHTLSSGTEIEVKVTLDDADLKKVLPFGDPNRTKVKVP